MIIISFLYIDVLINKIVTRFEDMSPYSRLFQDITLKDAALRQGRTNSRNLGMTWLEVSHSVHTDAFLSRHLMSAPSNPKACH